MNDNIYANIILDYINHGFSPIPVPYKTKAPITKEWNKLTVTADNYLSYFDGAATNIAILTGKRSGGLVDVDVDSVDALKFAPWFLPKTNCVFGRKSMPKSHWVYRVPDCRMTREFTAKRMILEVRGNNRCTIFPGSVHPSGEAVEFENSDDYAPSFSTWKKLKRAASKIAIATELSNVWSPGIRCSLTLSVAATLARFGWSVIEACELVTAVATEANDEELPNRLACIQSAFAAHVGDTPISGNERLIQLVGTDTAARIRNWASSPEGFREVSKLSCLLFDLRHALQHSRYDIADMRQCII